ncbi:hypothetical protein Pcinc_032121, partial [Petrolisthes cinctipes]
GRAHIASHVLPCPSSSLFTPTNLRTRRKYLTQRRGGRAPTKTSSLPHTSRLTTGRCLVEGQGEGTIGLPSTSIGSGLAGGSKSLERDGSPDANATRG